MKKGFVALLIGLALIVLISPGIVGRLAEKSVDNQLDWAANEAREIVVRSEGFDRGWFSSEGRHRLEIRDGNLRDLLLAYGNAASAQELPSLIIDTRLDHGLIPLSSMSRDNGSLVPGLGAAVSTVSLDTGSGELVPLPGTIYSTLGLTGDLHSNYVLGPGSITKDGATAEWGDVDIDITTSTSTGRVVFEGSIALLGAQSPTVDLQIENLRFSGDQRPSGFGFRVGPVTGSVDTIRPDGAPAPAIGPIVIDSTSAEENGRVTAHTSLRIENMPLQDFGTAKISLDVRIDGADAASLGAIKRRLERSRSAADPDAMISTIEADARRLVAAGLELHVDAADLTLAQGSVETEAHITIVASDADSFSWAGALLAAEATADVRIGEALVQLATVASPEVGGLVGMGYLRKRGDTYEMRVDFRNGLLTVNGAPLPIPLPGGQ